MEELNIYFSDDNVVCQECGEIVPFTDEGGRCETYYGWLCHDCIAKLTARGEQLHFEDEGLMGENA